MPHTLELLPPVTTYFILAKALLSTHFIFDILIMNAKALR